jgi:(1->4)-alpha-D-glucan 1-alpha-D-glucosylmutase
LLGAWPLDQKEMPEFMERLQLYAIKATREAMVHTRWTRPNIPHEQSLVHFAAAILRPGRNNLFLADFLRFQQKIAYFGMLNGLSQVLLKMTSPGVPDFYQGCDLWDLRLVDPDNRGPVDFKKRDALLRDIQERSQADILSYARELLENWQDGRIKLYLIWKTLNFRRQYRQLFLEGRFVPLQTDGNRGDNIVAYAREQDGMWVMAGVPRWLAQTKAPSTCAGVQQYWSGSHILLPEGTPDRWRNVLTGEWLHAGHLHGQPVLCMGEAFKNFPLALLSGERSSERDAA